ncbi:MAG: hypothetical protein GXP54_10040 [Deltaproteobacteria bacterium]|nr:hypothetical protein [Deltaproteobacteria bacterium]
MNRTLIAVSAALAVLAAGAPAGARSYNPDLGVFYQNGTVNTSAFKNYAGELGLALSPKNLGPATTLGSMGFELSLDLGLTTINSGESYWKAADDPAGSIFTTQIRVRKGLPYGLLIGGFVSHVLDSDLWTIGLEFGASVIEGYKYAPDVLILASLNTTLGAGDLSMLEVGAGLIISKSFSVAGLFNMIPIVGYNMVYVNASSHLTGTVQSNSTTVTAMVIPQQNIVMHRAVLGLEFEITYLVIGHEFTLGPGQTGYSFKIGTRF